MRRCSPPRVQVKAAGGVRTFDRLLAVRALGVSRVGATATRPIPWRTCFRSASPVRNMNGMAAVTGSWRNAASVS